MTTDDNEAIAEEVRKQGQIYTDEMENQHDLIEEYEIEQEDLEEFIETNLGNIDDDDTLAEVLYKMNEHMHAII